MDKGREFELRMGLERLREAAPELVPGFEAMLELSSFLAPPEWILKEADFPPKKDDRQSKATGD